MTEMLDTSSTGDLPRSGPSPERAFAERAGLFFEDAGLPRMSGRIIGWLLVCSPERQSAQQLAEALGASRASISTMTQLLQRAGLIERETIVGSRLIYYRHSSHTWSKQMRTAGSQVVRAKSLAEEGLRLLADADPKRRRRLDEMRRFYEFFERELSALMDRWEKESAER
jgi:DNA-binding transcriptional regulator GbsR (MarR family)